MSIFNSLGSNYSKSFVLRSLFNIGSSKAPKRLQTLLGEHYGGKAALTYKGREALQLALKWSGLPAGSSVGINGFTCYVVYQAVERAGYKPVFIDVEPRTTHFGLTQLTHAHTSTKDLKAIIVQYTLGYPVDMSALGGYCDKNGIMIIEDLAHSLGAVLEDGQEAGTVGELTMLSVSQDKPLDVVAGGAVIERRLDHKHANPKLKPTSWWQGELNRDYPLWTGLIRSTYSIGLGRIIHFGLKKLHLLATPMSDAGPGLHRMSKETARLVLSRWRKRDTELSHRREIAKIYKDNLPKELQLVHAEKGQPSYLRFPLWVDDRASLVAYLRNKHIHIGDTWYDAPIAPGRYLDQTSYKQGLCPNSEELCEHIANLPTHRHVTPKDAKNICAKIKQWQASQPKA